ncbi:unnamed protein product [Rotaria sordida]|uniref:Uncharacterized protein n=1 Tax=Rotaria sordida TaxID=392033 RepID=A0A819LZM4_9BILA|nr:unnamed protein product [Rotaria sordida]
MISSLVLIDTEHLHFLNYQFELYEENTSLINDVRTRIKQKQLPNVDRTKMQSLITTMDNDEILDYLDSFDYVGGCGVLDVPIQLYLERIDLWNDRVTDADLTAFQVHDDILLQRTYMILCGLER